MCLTGIGGNKYDWNNFPDREIRQRVCEAYAAGEKDGFKEVNEVPLEQLYDL